MLRERSMPPDITIRPEAPADAAAVEALYSAVFGPGRLARTATRIREGVPHDPRTSFVAVRGGLVIGAVRQTEVTVGGAPCHLLGPLGVAETAAKQGIGRALLVRSIAAAEAAGSTAVVLVGDLPFYQASGFAPVRHGTVGFPGPVEPHRLLVRPLRGAVAGPLLVEPWPAPAAAIQPDRAAAVPPG